MAEDLPEFGRRMNVLKDEQFRRFMGRNEVKLMISMIPPTQPREVLATLLESAFTNGAVFGVTMAAAEILKKAAGK